ncbi:hypothetical protein YC2023_062074 [Brassica napus]
MLGFEPNVRQTRLQNKGCDYHQNNKYNLGFTSDHVLLQREKERSVFRPMEGLPQPPSAFGGFGSAGVVVVGSGCLERWRRWF